MSNLKCPFCQQELETWAKYTDGTSKIWCSKCNLFGDSKLFSELIRTRKALEIAVDALKDFANTGKESEQEWFGVAVKNNAQKALEQITALEQKDK